MYNDSTNCPNCGSFISSYDYTSYIYFCRDCGQIFCNHCSEYGRCPNCGNNYAKQIDISEVNYLRNEGKIVGGKNKQFLDDREYDRRSQQELRRTEAIKMDNANFVRASLKDNGKLYITDASRLQPLGFNANNDIKELVIDTFIDTIPVGCFYACRELKKLTIKGNVRKIDKAAFQVCANLEEVVLPESLQEIADLAFSLCINLQKINLPDGLNKIGYSAFGDCKKLKILEISPFVNVDSKFSIDSISGKNTVKLINKFNSPEINNFENERFKNRSLNFKDFVSKNLDKNGCLRLSDSSVFEDGFFADTEDINTEGIKEVIISADVNKIPKRFFSRSKDLKKVVILSEHIKEIGKEAFVDCKNLTEITLPEGLRLIGKSAFGHCESLQEITLPESLRTIGKSAFDNCENLQEITLPEGLRTIGKNAFSYCKNLKKIKIPDKIEVIPAFCFKSCEILSEVILPKNLHKIEMNAFSECYALDSITVHYSVEVDEFFAGIYDSNRTFVKNCVELIRTGTEEEKREFEERIAAQNSGCLGVIAVMVLILWICV